MPHIASTLTADVDYAVYAKRSDPSGPHTVLKKIRIKGGANVANRKHLLADSVLTPRGVVTPISDEDLAILEQDEVFQTHKRNGFVEVIKSASAPSGDKAAKNLEPKDPSAPFSPEDYEAGGRAQKLAVPGADELEAPVVKGEDAAPDKAKKGKK